MHILAPFWHAAARLSGRLDLGPLLDAAVPPCRWPSLSAESLTAYGLPARRSRALCASPPLRTPHRPITLADPDYPARLRAAQMPPPVLFAEGDVALFARPTVAIVGARRCTADGARLARRLAAAVAEAGGVVVSGLAWGIDTAAHEAAAHATIAVVGQGLGRPFTAAQDRLRHAVRGAGGLIVSEFHPDRPASRHTFPQRNRVIAGLSDAVVVVEAGGRSGALITARVAGDLGRDVGAVPGHPLAPTAEGCLRLLQQGAAMITDEADVYSLVPALAESRARRSAARRATDPLLGLLQARPLDFDRLLQESGWSVPDLTRRLAALELAGELARGPGDTWRLAAG